MTNLSSLPPAHARDGELADLDEDGSSADQAVLEAVIPEPEAGQRLDKVLAALFPQYSRSRLQQWCEAGLVRMGAQIAGVRDKARAGELLRIAVPALPEDAAFAPEEMPLDVVFEDASLAVINKPAGLVVHPAAGNWSGTLLNGLLARYPETAGLPRAGIVHRLDKDTSGLMVTARTLEAQTELVRRLQARTMHRQYLALVWGRADRLFNVDAPIARHPRDRLRMAVVQGGKPARTDFAPLAELDTPWGPLTALRCKLHSGRTHQIRVHLQFAKLELVADPVYGGRVRPDLPLQRQALHAARLGFRHPGSGAPLDCVAPVPDDIAAFWDACGGAPEDIAPKRWPVFTD
ncbi:MAG: RluA family pseudouridine synthase [Thiomonas sp.]|nr:RluA family pseudouridine synthase [Thiomonas sp.]